MQRGMCNLSLNQTPHIQLKYWDKLWSCKYLVTRTSSGTAQGCQQRLYLLILAKCPQDKNLLIFIDNTLRKSEELNPAYHFNLKALAKPTLAAQIIWLQLQSKWENRHKYKLSKHTAMNLKWLGTETFETSYQAFIHSKIFHSVS